MKALGLLSLVAISSVSGQITRPWVSTYNGQGDLNDRFACAAKDAAGEVHGDKQ
jgi:hypothetical protein